MSSMSKPLASLVANLAPESRTDRQLREELIAQCQDVLSSHIGQSREPDVSQLTDLIQRHLAQDAQPNSSIQRFTNLISRLSEQPLLSRKAAVMQFLHSLAASNLPTSNSVSFLPSVDPPQALKQRTTLETGRDAYAVNKSTGRTKAEILRQYRLKAGKPQAPEEALLRDALYIMQGISGKYVSFVESDRQYVEAMLQFSEDPSSTISAPNRSLIHRLSELGHLYRRIASFVRPKDARVDVGVIEQSLCHYLETQLTEYYRLIAILESQMHLSSSEDKGGLEDESLRTGLTLKRLDVWVGDWRLRLRMMSACVEGCRDVSGGALVNLIHSYTNNGDPFVRRFTDELLEEVSKPFFNILHKWLFSGELNDPYSEFFVALDPELRDVQYIQPHVAAGGGDDGFATDKFGEADEVSREHESGLRLWEGKYIMREEMLPAFVGETFGRKIFSTGKSLNFIRYSCHDSDWVATREKLISTGGPLKYSDIAGLERSIDSAYSIASQRLFDVFFDKFKLLDHLSALKHYMMLGHGDFAEQLMEALGPSLSRPANTLYRHNLTATLEAAIRSSNAQHDPPDVLRRLDARMLEYSHGEIGWDVFTLEYKVDAPIDTVLDSENMIKYLKMFSHLWKMKRVEGLLSAGWMRMSGGARTFFRVPELDAEWHQIRLLLAEMIHFLRQMQAYCQLEVIECQWKKLLDFINKKEGDLDSLMTAHRQYIENTSKKVLLWNNKPGKEEILLDQVKEIFDIIIQFRTATDDLYNYTLAEAARQDSMKDENRGLYSDPRTQRRSSASDETLSRILQRTRDYGNTFQEKVQAIVVSLASHTDGDCKFLGVRLSFSDFYKTRRDTHTSHKHHH